MTRSHVGCDISHQFNLQRSAKSGILFSIATAVAPVLAFRWPVDSAAPEINVGGLEVDKMVRSTSSNVLRRITTLLIITSLLTVALSVNTAAALPGSGTQDDPYRIESLADFDEFAADPNYWSGFTRLETDVNLAGRTYTTAVIAPDIDSSTSGFQGTAFTGVFDGNDHKITGLTIDGEGANDYLGLFGRIYEGEVRNLGLEGGSVSGDDGVAGLAGENEGSVSNCYSTGDVNGNDYVGGLLGANDGDISSCHSAGDVSGDYYVGNLVGINVGIISNCYSTGDVSGDFCVGGLVGININYDWPNLGTISNCYSTGSVTGIGAVGGLAGYNDDSPISDCYSTGDVNGVDEVGGLLGDNWGSVSNCYATGDVNGVEEVGGLVGRNCDGSVSNCYSTGDVSGDYYVGGLVGINGIPRYSGGIVSNCYSTGDVNGVDYVGGLVGANASGDLETSFWDVETSGEPNMCGSQGGLATACDPNCGKTTAEMQTTSTFTEAGWDFVDIWLINEGATYPVLRQEIRSDLNGIGGVDFLDFAIFADHWLEGTGD